MSNLVEVSQWEPGIYQLETSDPVEGGPDGIDNMQGRQLANRTRYLKDQFDGHVAAANPHPQYATLVQMQNAINALVAAAPGALDTLKELADAIGDDPNFAVTMTNALALKAAIDSPFFTGTPQGPTPAQFDSGKRLATMEAVQRALGNFQACRFVNAVTALTTADLGKNIWCGGAGSYPVALPAVAAGTNGGALYFWASSSSITLNRTGSDNILVNSKSVTSLTLNEGDSLTLVAVPGTGWLAIGGSVQLASAAMFASSLGMNGFQKLGGYILQVGNYNTTGTSTAQGVAFPIAFPTACVALSANPVTALGLGCIDEITSKDKNGFNVVGSQVQNASANYSAHAGTFIALGY